MKKIIFLCISSLMITAVIFFTHQKSSAQIVSFDGVIPFSTPGGLQGFFDQKSGTLYYYDQNLNNCVLIAKVQQLGQPLQKLK